MIFPLMTGVPTAWNGRWDDSRALLQRQCGFRVRRPVFAMFIFKKLLSILLLPPVLPPAETVMQVLSQLPQVRVASAGVAHLTADQIEQVIATEVGQHGAERHER